MWRDVADRTLAKGHDLTWDKSPNLDIYVNELEATVQSYLAKSTLIHDYYVSVSGRLPLLDSCTFAYDTFATHIEEIQKITQVALKDFGNSAGVNSWLISLNSVIGKKLQARLVIAVQLWRQTLAQPVARFAQLSKISHFQRGLQFSLWRSTWSYAPVH